MIINSTDKLVAAREQFSQVLSGREHSNAFIVSAPKGAGKAKFVEDVARRVLSSDDEYRANMMWLSNNQGKITTDQVRGIYTFLSKTSYNKLPRIVVIDSVDYLNIQASNALLKILEDCSVNAYFVLLCHNLNTVLRTVRSRCISIRVPVVYNISTDVEEKYSYLAHGIQGIAKKLESELALEFYFEILDVIENLDTNIQVLYSFLDKYFAKEVSENKWANFVQLLEHFMGTLLKVSCGYRVSIIEKETMLMDRLLGSRDVEQLGHIVRSIRHLTGKAELCSLSMYNVVLLTFFQLKRK